MRSWQKRICIFASVLCGGSLLLALLLGYGFWQERSQVVQATKDRIKREAALTAQRIDAQLRKLMPVTEAIVGDLGSGALPKAELLKRLRTALESHPELLGVGVAFAPFVYDPELRLYAPSYFRKDETLHFVQLDALYDYTEPEYAWYHLPIADGAAWIEPFFSESSQALVAEFAAPFFYPANAGKPRELAGVAHTSMAIDDLHEVLDDADLGETGYGFLLSKKGVFIFHPHSEVYVRGRKTIFDVAEAVHDAQLRAMGERAIRGVRGVVDSVEEMTGQPAWIFFEPIPSTGWSLGVVFFKDQIPTQTQASRRQLIQVVLWSLAFLFFLSTLVLAWRYTGRVGTLWWGVVSVSILCSVGIVSICYVTFTGQMEENHGIVFSNKTYLDKFLIANTKAAIKRNVDPPIYIPTGIFVQSLEFVSANNVNLTGYIWQKYPASIPADVSRGFILPEAVSGGTNITEAYRRTEQEGEVIGWYVKATLRENFDYSRYPFDQQNVRIRLWRQEFDKHIILIPDLESYSMMHPASHPGLEENFTLPGWIVDKTFFGYKLSSYNTNFGISGALGQRDFPELYFNIILKREIVNPFFSNVLPVLVASFIIFGLMIISTKHPDKIRFLNVTAKDILSTSAYIFFVIILAQINMRGKISSEKILYIEYFYFVMYFMILSVSMNAIVFYTGTHFSFVEYQDNLLAKLLYWPIILWMLLLITLFIFY